MRSTLFLVLLSPTVALAATTQILSRQASDPSGWSFLGCFTDSVKNRVLRNDFYSEDLNMTHSNCFAHCSSNGYTYAGTGRPLSLRLARYMLII
jgi:hypothetical protein